MTSQEQEMVTRVARAMRESERANNAGVMRSWEDAADNTKARFRQKAAVALRTISEPTDAMCEAARDEINTWGIGVEECKLIWRAMVQSALSKGGE